MPGCWKDWNVLEEVTVVTEMTEVTEGLEVTGAWDWQKFPYARGFRSSPDFGLHPRGHVVKGIWTCV